MELDPKSSKVKHIYIGLYSIYGLKNVRFIYGFGAAEKFVIKKILIDKLIE